MFAQLLQSRTFILVVYYVCGISRYFDKILTKVFVGAINVTTMILLLSFQMSNPILEGLHEIAQGEFICYGW